MVKKAGFLIAFSTLALTLSPTLVFAQETTSATTPATFRYETKQERQQLQQIRQTARDDRMEFRASKSADRQLFLQNMQQAREEAKIKFQAERAAFKEKVMAIRDTRKQQLVKQIQNRMIMVNTNRTTIMSQNLERLTTILANIQTRSATAKTSGKDTTSVDAAAANAQSAITAAQTAVAAQAGKEYTITLTATEGAALKANVGQETKQFEADMHATYQLMIAAKQAVMQAAQALATVMGTTKINTSTGSAIAQ